MPLHKSYIYTEPTSQGTDSAIKGQKGSTGTRGIDGRKGERGQKGSNGLDGHTSTIVGSFAYAHPNTLPKSGTLPVGWDDGVNPPIPFSLEVGESLIDARTGELWGFTPGSNTTNWTKYGRISGPAGSNGSKGERGFKGETGSPGTGGIDGERGLTGKTGAKGHSGVKGQKGDKGRCGAPGVNGTNGTSGAKGQKGNAGLAGKNGIDGLPGLKGDSGNKGEKGTQGSPGPRGLRGDRGLTGDSAPTNLLPKAGGTIIVESLGLLNGHNVSKIVSLGTGKLQVFFASPLETSNYTAIATAQTKKSEELFTASIEDKTDRHVTLVIRNSENNKLASHGVISFVIFGFGT